LKLIGVEKPKKFLIPKTTILLAHEIKYTLLLLEYFEI